MSDLGDSGPALALLEYASIAAGIEVGDAMVKRSPLGVIHAGTVHPGRYLLLVGGEVADIEEALDAADRVGVEPTDRMFLPDPHRQLVEALGGGVSDGDGEALGVIETDSVAAVIRAADAGLKEANVTLRQVFMADGLGGKGYLLFSGSLTEIEAATAAGADRAGTGLVAERVIAQIHAEMDENLAGNGQFVSRVRG